jgi:hypothetical protein
MPWTTPLLLLAWLLPVGAAQEVPGTSVAPTTRPATAPATNPAPDGSARVHGIVLDPARKPVAGARVVVVVSRPNTSLPPPEALAEGKSGNDGRFDLTFRKPEARTFPNPSNFESPLVPADTAIAPARVAGMDAAQSPLVVASADGSGAAWDQSDRAGELTLRLVRDRPIEGRICDLEGRPVAGVTVRPYAILPYVASDATPVNRAPSLKEPEPTLYHPSLSSTVAQATTDTDGRFRITGVGADRTVILHFDSPRVALPPVQVITRNQVPPTRMAKTGGRVFGGQQYYSAKPELFAAPARSVIGKVRDLETHRPLAGVKVVAISLTGSRQEAMTDAQGEFHVGGLAKGLNRLQITPPADLPYFAHERELPDQPGIGPLRLDIDLRPGVWITGRVIDKATGNPVPAFVQYAPLLSNKHAAIPEYQAVEGVRFFQGPQGSGTTAADGSFRVVGLPGAGLVAVVSRDERYPKGQGADQLKQSLPAQPDPGSAPGRATFETYQPWMGPDRITAVRPVELPAKSVQNGVDKAAEATAAQVDFRLDRGKVVKDLGDVRLGNIPSP